MADQAPDGLNELLAAIHEHLKRHEEKLDGLTLQVESLLSIQRGSDRTLIEQAMQRGIDATREAHALQVRVFDEIIARLRGT